MNVNDLMENGHFYSEHHKDLMSSIVDDKQMREYRIDNSTEDVVGFMKEYSYKYGAWPVIISAEHKDKWSYFIKKLPGICYKSLLLMFETAEDFGEYFNTSPILFDIIKSTSIDFRDMILRYDMVFSDNLFKVLEINAGTNIGGWQLGWLASKFREALSLFNKTRHWNLNHRHTVELMLVEIINGIKRMPSYKGEKNILFYLSDQSVAMKKTQEAFSGLFDELKIKKSYHGELYWTSSSKEINVDINGEVSFQGRPIEAFIFNIDGGGTIERNKMMQLINSYCNDKLVFPDCPLLTLVGNKHMLALLHRAKQHGILEKEEVDLIESHIPWTVKSNAKSVEWDGLFYDLKELLKTKKNQFVIKKSQSMKGKDVFIGRSTSDADWKVLVDKYIDQSDWLIQEYQVPDMVPMCEQNGFLGEYHVVWGVFDIGSCYGGSFIRASRLGTGNGVINSASGAVEFAVFEESARKNRISL